MTITLLDGAVLVLISYITVTTTLRDPIMLRGLPFATLLSVVYVYLLARNVSDYRLLYRFVGLFGSLVAAYGIGQYSGWMQRNAAFPITGFFNNPGPYAGLLLVLLPASFMSVLNSRNLVKYGYGASFGVIIIALLLTQSRAAMLATIISCGWIVISQRKCSRKLSLPKRITTVTFLVGSIGVGFWGLVQLRPASVWGRTLIAKVTLSMITDAPWLGIGFSRFGITYPDYQAAYLASHPEEANRQLAGMTYYAFNEPLQITATLGVVGLILVLGIATLSFSGKKKSSEGITARAILLAVLMFGLFSYPFSNAAIGVVVSLALATVASLANAPYVCTLTVPKSVVLIITTLGISGSLLFLVYQYRRYQAVQSWKEAATLVTYDPARAFQQYQTIYPVLSDYGDFLFNYGAELSEANRYQESIRVLERTRWLFNHIDLHMYLGKSYQGISNYKKAEKAYLHAAHMIPHRFYPRYLLATMYDSIGRREDALQTARQIVDMPVKVPSQTVENIKAEMESLIGHY